VGPRELAKEEIRSSALRKGKECRINSDKKKQQERFTGKGQKKPHAYGKSSENYLGGSKGRRQGRCWKNLLKNAEPCVNKLREKWGVIPSYLLKKPDKKKKKPQGAELKENKTTGATIRGRGQGCKTRDNTPARTKKKGPNVTVGGQGIIGDNWGLADANKR